jgi:hypothetical protein
MNKLGVIVFVGCNISACARVSFSPDPNQLVGLAANEVTLSSVVVSTKKNQSVTFSAGTANGKQVGNLSLSSSFGTNSLMTPNGSVQIVDATAFKVKYTPKESYVGIDLFNVYATDPFGNFITGIVTINIGNVLNSIQPALAVRGISCITCHSNVSSNIITDYGYGNTWYFDAKSSDSFYYDRLGAGNGLDTLNLLNGSKIIVPAAPATTAIQNQFGITTLAQFIQSRFAPGTSNKNTQVSEVASLKISIPTAARIQQVFNNPTTNQVYIPDTQSSPDLAGLIFDQVNNVFKISNMICDGDLYLGATVLFNNAIIQSINGCRIHTIGNAFIDTPIQSAAYQGSVNFNTQVMSAQSIWMGTGKIIQNNLFCETSGGKPTGWYSNPNATGSKDCTIGSNATNPNCDTLTMRLSAMLNRNTFSTAYPDPKTLAALMSSPLSGISDGAVIKARTSVEASIGHSLYDASCGPGGRNVSISRLMLVAPYVNNRYSGNFSGSTIAESALMSLGTFTYTFDPVFAKVSVFSLFDAGELVSGEGL